MLLPPRTGPVIAAIVITAVGACSDLPMMPDAVSDTGYPALVPADQITGRVPRPSPETGGAAPTQARAEGLRPRAARLAGPVIDDATRERMKTGVNP